MVSYDKTNICRLQLSRVVGVVIAAVIFAMATGANTVSVKAAVDENAAKKMGQAQSNYAEEESAQDGEAEIELRVTQVFLAVENILQNPELPNGCEATSLAMVLNYLGYSAEKTELAEQYVTSETLTTKNGVVYGPNPNDTYVGNPADSTGYYILAEGLAQAANDYLKDYNSEMKATNISGASEEELAAKIENGTPVILWTTMDFGDAQYTRYGWVLESTGEYYIPYVNLHCVVLIGYNEENYILCNPLQEGVQTVARAALMYGYSELRMQAMIIE
jgi:uncharacterized protein YvpB